MSFTIETSCKAYSRIIKGLIRSSIDDKSPPCLCVVQIDNNEASNKYIKGKEKDCNEVGIKFIHHKIQSASCSQEEVCHILKTLSQDNSIDGIILQLPVPDKYNVEELQKYICPSKDVDGFRNDSPFEPCTPSGIIDWLEFNYIDLEGKKVCVLGRSKIVGKPLVKLLIDKGCTVFACNSKTKNIKEIISYSDIVISAIGKPKYFGKWCIDYPSKRIFVDVGINFDENGKMCGDFNKEEIEDNCTYITPVPGGVGLLTRVQLLKNVLFAKIEKGSTTDV